MNRKKPYSRAFFADLKPPHFLRIHLFTIQITARERTTR
jgi:hypothetical protein